MMPMHISSADGLSFDELMLEIEAEPALAASVLREANIIESGVLPTVKLHEAGRRLGRIRLCEIVEQSFTQNQGVSPDAEKLWERSLRRAIAARLLAERTGIIDPAEAYTLGLLHDAGEMLFNSLFPAEMTFMQDLDIDTRIEREIIAFGVEQSQVGQWLLESWGVPRSLAAIAQSHRDVMQINTPTALLLHIADRIAQADDPDKVLAHDTSGSSHLAKLRIERDELVSIHLQTTAAIKEYVA
jgi:HD-like signal output (HDOD) protein